MISSDTTSPADLATAPASEEMTSRSAAPTRAANWQRVWLMVAPLLALFVWSYAAVFVELATLGLRGMFLSWADHDRLPEHMRAEMDHTIDR